MSTICNFLNLISQVMYVKRHTKSIYKIYIHLHIVVKRFRLTRWSLDSRRAKTGSNSKGQLCTLCVTRGTRKVPVSHQCTVDLRARQFSGLGLNIDGAGWYRLMYIHRPSRSPQSNRRERYLSLRSPLEGTQAPSLTLRSILTLAASMTKDEEGSLITTSDAARIVEFSYLLRFSLYRARSPPPPPVLTSSFL